MQKTVTVQLAETVYGNGSALVLIVAGMTALILFLAANTAFSRFPVLGSNLAQDRYCPGSCTPAATGKRTGCDPDTR